MRYNVNLCPDCVLALAGYDQHEIGHEPDKEPIAHLDHSHWYSALNPEPHFSKSPCDGCRTTLAGDRYEYEASGD
jgi:hypothetical protein